MWHPARLGSADHKVVQAGGSPTRPYGVGGRTLDGNRMVSVKPIHQPYGWSPFPFREGQRKKQYHLNIRFVSIATWKYDNKKSAPCGGGEPAARLVVGFEAVRPNEFHDESAGKTQPT